MSGAAVVKRGSGMTDGLQFDHVEQGPGPSLTACAACRRPLEGVYFVAQGSKICAACRTSFEQVLKAGSGTERFLRALIFGLVAAAVGSVINYWVTIKAGWGLGLISLLIGYLVGISVRRGSENRGGWPYQALAMALTYLSIVGMFVPALYEAIQQKGASFLLFGVVLIAPFLGGKDTIFMLILTGIALYEAWKLNRGLRVSFTGPFPVSGPPPETKPVG